MGRPIMSVVAALIVVTGVALGVARLRERARGVAADVKLIRGDTGDVMASATYQRFAARRQAVAIMKTALKSLAAAESTALANAYVPVNPVPESQAPADPLRAPRHHRDWGPVNNTPPPMPYIVKNACDGEGCLRPGTWAACGDVAALREKGLDAPMVFTIHGGEKFTALAIDLHVDVPGMVVFRHAISNPPGREGNQVDSIAFTPSDTLYLLNSLGEGDWVWWFRGKLGQGYQFWRDTAVLVRRPTTIHWVRARNTAGQEGWIVFDYEKLGRCVRPRG